MADYNNAARNMIFREAVAQRFALAGIRDAAPAPRQKPSEIAWDKPKPGHIVGLRDAEVMVSAAVTGRPAEGLADAEEAARASGKPFAALVLGRAEKPTAESYVVVTLATFAALLADREAEH